MGLENSQGGAWVTPCPSFSDRYTMSTEAPAELTPKTKTIGSTEETKAIVRRAAADMTALSDALIDRVGGVSGWADRYINLMDRCKKTDNKRVEADLLKMIPDTMEKASKAGQRALEDLTDAELEEVRVAAIKDAIMSDPALAHALAKNADILDVQQAEAGNDEG
jgi:hypothetical protein